MNGFDWLKKESYSGIGSMFLHNKIAELLQKYNTNIVVTRLRQDTFSQNDHYTVEAWYNFDSHCYIVNAYCTEYVID